jgi:hypothetical protein
VASELYLCAVTALCVSMAVFYPLWNVWRERKCEFVISIFHYVFCVYICICAQIFRISFMNVFCICKIPTMNDYYR